MRTYYADLAAQGLRMPIGADLLLHEHSDPEAVLHDAARLGRTVEAAARRYRTPLAFPLMDLRLEKADLLEFLGVPEPEIDAWHFSAPPPAETLARLQQAARRPFSPRIQANQGAVRYIAKETDLHPVGMMIGPFSLMTKLVADPIAPVAMAAAGTTAEEDEGVLTVERALALALETCLRSARAQLEAGARAIIVCEPAASIVYLSPRALRRNPEFFDRFVLEPNRQLRALLEAHGADLILHNCGELIPSLIEAFCQQLRPAVLSLGSSRVLWEDAVLVPQNIVLFGNLPTKMFYSDSSMPIEEVSRLTKVLAQKMLSTGHPFVLGSECDVLHVPDAAATIRAKVAAMLEL